MDGLALIINYSVLAFQTGKASLQIFKLIPRSCQKVLFFQLINAKSKFPIFPVDANKCYVCGTTSGSPMDVDNCGNFDDKTPTCTLTGDNKCWKTSTKA